MVTIIDSKKHATPSNNISNTGNYGNEGITTTNVDGLLVTAKSNDIVNSIPIASLLSQHQSKSLGTTSVDNATPSHQNFSSTFKTTAIPKTSNPVTQSKATSDDQSRHIDNYYYRYSMQLVNIVKSRYNQYTQLRWSIYDHYTVCIY